MSNKKILLSVHGPILAGSLSQVRSKCGKPTCRCQSGKNADLHGPYYRWSGYIDGKLSHRTLTPEMAQDCERWIKNYHHLQNQLTDAAQKALEKFLGSLQKSKKR